MHNEFTYLLTITSFSQEIIDCNTKSTDETENTQSTCDFEFSEIPSDFSNETPYVFNVFFHKFVADDGSTPDLVSPHIPNPDGIGDGDLIDEEEYLEAMRALNIKYNKFNIFFKYTGHDIIPESDFLEVVFSIDQNIDTYHLLKEYVRNNTDENGEIYYKDNAFNLYITHQIGFGALGRAGVFETESIYKYKVFQPNRTTTETFPPRAKPYDYINKVVPHEIGHNFGLLHTYRNANNSLNDYLFSERVTRDVTDIIKPYNANSWGDHVADTRADNSAITANPIYKDLANCSCNNVYIIENDIRDRANNANGIGDLYLDAPVYNIMNYLFIDEEKPSHCNQSKIFTNGQGFRARCLIEHRSNIFFPVLNVDGVASLYEPYSGDYFYAGPNTENNITKFQYGFDYNFVECGVTPSNQQIYNIPSEYGDTSFSYTYGTKNVYDKYWEPNHNINQISHPNHTAIIIEQIDASQPQKCYNNHNRSAVGGTVTKFNDNILNTNVTITPQDSLNINNGNLIQNLQQGLYKIKKNYEDGSTEEQIILKQNN